MKTSVIVPIFKGKGGAMSYQSYRGVELLEHAKKIVERAIERQIRTQINLNKTQFRFLQGKESVDAMFIVKRIQEKN